MLPANETQDGRINLLSGCDQACGTTVVVPTQLTKSKNHTDLLGLLGKITKTDYLTMFFLCKTIINHSRVLLRSQMVKYNSQQKEPVFDFY